MFYLITISCPAFTVGVTIITLKQDACLDRYPGTFSQHYAEFPPCYAEIWAKGLGKYSKWGKYTPRTEMHCFLFKKEILGIQINPDRKTDPKYS